MKHPTQPPPPYYIISSPITQLFIHVHLRLHIYTIYSYLGINYLVYVMALANRLMHEVINVELWNNTILGHNV